jgi:ornithine cyclodeaminase/alanine dehydrogenase
VAGSDIIISTVPGSDMLSPFLDAGMLAPGSFVSAVDLGRSWHGESFTDLDLICTDDHTQSKEQKALGKLNNPRPFDADLGDLCGRKHPGRTTAQQRCIFMFPGFALSDLALAVLYYRAAIAGKVGQVLRR